MNDFLFNLPPAHLIYNIQRDSEINSNIYIPPLQLGEINPMPIFKQQQAPVSTSCYTWAAPWGLQGFLGTARDFLSHRDQCLPAWVVFKHLGSQSPQYVKAAAGGMMHLCRGTECSTGEEKPGTSLVSTVIWSHPHHQTALLNILPCPKSKTHGREHNNNENFMQNLINPH